MILLMDFAMDFIIIPIGSFYWFLQLILSGFAVFFVLMIGKRISPLKRIRLGEGMGFLLLFLTLFFQFYYLAKGVWSQNTLPLELCNWVGFIAVVALYTRRPWFYEVGLFVGVVGPLQALLAPAIFHGSDPVLVIFYYVTHWLVIIAPLYLTFVVGMRPRPLSWLTSPLKFSLIVLSTMAYDAYFSTNHMFLMERPPIDHLMNFGQWPYYILFWAAVCLSSGFLLSRWLLKWDPRR